MIFICVIIIVDQYTEYEKYFHTRNDPMIKHDDIFYFNICCRSKIIVKNNLHTNVHTYVYVHTYIKQWQQRRKQRK